MIEESNPINPINPKEPTQKNPDSSVKFDGISDTNRITAMLRLGMNFPQMPTMTSLCQIPDDYIAQLLQEKKISEEPMGLRFAVQARYLLFLNEIERFLKNREGSNVLDIANGLSPTAYILENPKDVVYVETDLPSVVGVKKNIVESFPYSFTGKSHQVVPLDILVKSELDGISHEYFSNSRPVCVVSEGLLIYFNQEQVETMARNIHSLLSQNGGEWIFDISTIARTQAGAKKLQPASLGLLQIFNSQSGGALRPFLQDDEAVVGFFSKLGFSAEQVKPSSVEIEKMKKCMGLPEKNNANFTQKLFTNKVKEKALLGMAVWRLKIKE